MNERTKTYEVEAPEQEIQKALENWWKYLEVKTQVHPHLSGGISHDIVHDIKVDSPENTRTINLSLVPTISPELGSLGRLTSAERPHIYVEGIRNPSVQVPFEEIYAYDRYSRKRAIERGPFTADPANNLPRYLKLHGIEPSNFLLWIYSANDMEMHWKNFQDFKVLDLVFLKTRDEQFRAYALSNTWKGFFFKPLSGIGKIHQYIRETLRISYAFKNSTSITPATDEQIKIVQDGFQETIAQLQEKYG